MIKIRLISPLDGVKRGPKTERGKRHASQNARKYDFSRNEPLNATDEKYLDEIREELLDPNAIPFWPHEGITLFMSIRKAARIRREIEALMIKIASSAQADDASEFDRDLDKLSRLHNYERRARSAITKTIMKGGDKATSKLSSLRRKITR